jgi:hypothetical protein
MGDDLIIFFRRERNNLSGFRNEGCPGTSGSDVGRKQEILFHEQHRLQSTKNSSLLANSNTSNCGKYLACVFSSAPSVLTPFLKSSWALQQLCSPGYCLDAPSALVDESS